MSIKRLNIVLRSSWRASTTNDSTNDVDPTDVPKLQKPKSWIKKLKGSDIKWSNLYGNQATHFANCIESPNANNSSYNYKNVRTASNVGPTICLSSAKEGKTQVG
jgi:hypothetical protein